MAKLKKKGQEGIAVEYITRNRALKKLQLKARDFRRLCILKGIYPRDPKHKSKIPGTATNKSTIYLSKDIQFLAHEPLLAKFRALRAFNRRIKKYIGLKSWAKVRSLEKNARPQLCLDHLVRERYPSFVDALRDLDDPLSMLALFSNLPRTSNDHQADVSRRCERLLKEFEAYIIATGSLKKAFISIKGIYYQASVMGQTVTWVTPHEFTTPVPNDVDFEVMLTFLEFYLVLVRFVNYRLFKRLGWEYPQKSIVTGENILLKATLPPIENSEEVFPEGDHRLLADAKVYLSREVPKRSLSFVLQAMGAEVGFPVDEGTSSITEDDLEITHQIVDRPIINRIFAGRQYVQPQWVFDSLNAGSMLATAEYAVGAELPPHLSPFAQEEEEEDDDDHEDNAQPEHYGTPTTLPDAEEGANRQAGSNNKKNRKKGKKLTEAQRELAVSMLSKKRQKLYERMQFSRQKQSDAKKKLSEKRNQAASMTAKSN